MSWVKCELGDVVTLKRGHDLPNGKRKEGGIPVVSSSGITGWHNEAKAERPGVVTGRYGTIGEVFFLDRPYWPLNTALYAIDFHGNDPRFVAYFLRSHLKNYKSEKAAVPGVDRNVLHKIKVQCPDLPTQERIAGVLSAYDDLIENNRRRIALLEQAARLLYREWFVHFRFPGYETAKFVDGLPEGWEETTIKQHCPFAYGKALKADTRVEGSFDVFGSSGIVGSHNKSLVAEGAIIVGRKGNVGSVFWSEKGFWPIDTVYYIAPENSDYFTFFALKHMIFISTDVAVPGLNRDFAHSRKLLLPTAELLEDFNARAALYFGQVQALTKANKKLAKVRDLLLPRLMDGRLPVPE